NYYSDPSPVVQTTHGSVRGALHQTLYDDSYYGFDGIPYAKPPLGELRFKAPQDVEPWKDVLDCSQPRDKCLQLSSLTKQVEGSEDCLYLNIAAKTLHSEKPLPVMIYIHGGVFIRGEASSRAWSPDYLMREEVIYISIGYRLGAFGFLSFVDPALQVPGNAALKDVVLALKWIRANVSRFNGDADNITLIGHSAGSMFVHLLMLSPQAEGLFHKAILMAGFANTMLRLPNMEYRIAKKLGYSGDNKDVEVFDFLNNVDPKLLAAVDIWTESERLQYTVLKPYVPCVEPYATASAILRAEPSELQRSAWSNKIPIMVGTTSMEAHNLHYSFLENKQLLQGYTMHPEYLLPRTLQERCNSEQQKELSQALVQKLTTGDYHPLAILATHNMLHSQHILINARLAYSQADNYLYRFDFDSVDFNFQRIRICGPNARGCLHADELSYLFKLPATFKLDESRAEYATIWRFVAMFVEFARRSNPNAPLTQPLVDWKPVSRSGGRMCLNINEDLKFIPQPEHANMEFYDQLYKEVGLEQYVEFSMK
ncbi:esterase B1-like, partial [Drosophila busckii]|uniref:esterase B1-like n=1 Tax=Drosophila busckii TaxID=30019 RepID=UPI0014328891